MKSVVYSATRQWNPGDEFILQGSINLMKSAIGEHNAILYNRHPDLRPLWGEGRFRRVREDWSNPQVNEWEKDYKIGFFDNSVKFDTDLNFADFAVVAGSPECFNPRTENFYRHVAESGLPLLALGVGHVDDFIPEWIASIFRKARLATVRSRKVGDALRARLGMETRFFPCPALFCIPCGREKRIERVGKVALVFAASARDTIPCQEISDEAFSFILNFYRTLLETFRDEIRFEIVCHYIDELPVAFREFRRFGVDVRYSFNAQEYADIYRECDFVVSPRVHGCGIASSLGIPSIHVSHDALRSDTTDGFRARTLQVGASMQDALELFRDELRKAEETNLLLIECKKKAFEECASLVRDATRREGPVRYDVTIPPEPENFAETPDDVAAILAPTTKENPVLSEPPRSLSRRIWNRLTGKNRS